MSGKQIQKLRFRWSNDDGVESFYALAHVLQSNGQPEVMESAGHIFKDDDKRSWEEIKDMQCADLREKLYTAGFSTDEVEEAEYATMLEPDFVEPNQERRLRLIADVMEASH